jgi:hypothetical protein
MALGQVVPFRYNCTGAPYSNITWGMNNRIVGCRSSETSSHPIDMTNDNNDNRLSHGTAISWGHCDMYTFYFLIIRNLLLENKSFKRSVICVFKVNCYGFTAKKYDPRTASCTYLVDSFGSRFKSPLFGCPLH